MANDQFSDFIIKSIIKSVSYDPTSNKIRLDDVSVTDEEIEQIVIEGQRKGFERSESIKMLQSVSENISFLPSIKDDYSSIEFEKLDFGQFFKIYFNAPDLGLQELSLIHLQKTSFFVMDSSINCIHYSDIIEPTVSSWHPNYFCDFIVQRNNNRFPNSSSYLRLGKLLKMDLFIPSFVYTVIDQRVEDGDQVVNIRQLNPYRALLKRIRKDIKEDHLIEDYDNLLCTWIKLGGTSFTLSLILDKELLGKPHSITKRENLSFFYEQRVEVKTVQEVVKVKRNVPSEWFWIPVVIIFLIMANIIKDTVQSRDTYKAKLENIESETIK